MKKLLLFIIITLLLLGSITPTEASPQKTDWQLVKEVCKKKGYNKIKLIKSNNLTDKAFWKIITHRKNKKYILVEKITSVSDGAGYGWYSTKTKKSKYIIGYNKKVPKGRKITSYVIYNPRTNISDDILCVIDNQKIRY